MEKEIKDKDSAVSTIKYKGTVTLKTVDKKGRVRKIVKCNKGMQGMFNFLLKCLAYKYDQIYAPTYIMGYTDEEGNSPAFSRLQPINSNPVLLQLSSGAYIPSESPPFHRVQYSCLVPNSTFINPTSTTLKCLKLLNMAAGNVSDYSNLDEYYVCAQLNLTETELTLANENLLIYWDIEFIKES